MLREHDIIVLTEDVSEEGDLKVGDVGTIVHIHPGRDSYVVEFTTVAGKTVAVATVRADQARPVTGEDITHARKVTIAA